MTKSHDIKLTIFEPRLSLQFGDAKHIHIVVQPSPELFFSSGTIQQTGTMLNKNSVKPIIKTTHLPPPPAAGNHPSISCLHMNLAALRTSCKWNQAIGVLLWPACSLGLMSSRFIHLLAGVRICFLSKAE